MGRMPPPFCTTLPPRNISAGVRSSMARDPNDQRATAVVAEDAAQHIPSDRTSRNIGWRTKTRFRHALAREVEEWVRWMLRPCSGREVDMAETPRHRCDTRVFRFRI